MVQEYSELEKRSLEITKDIYRFRAEMKKMIRKQKEDIEKQVKKAIEIEKEKILRYVTGLSPSLQGRETEEVSKTEKEDASRSMTTLSSNFQKQILLQYFLVLFIFNKIKITTK